MSAMLLIALSMAVSKVKGKNKYSMQVSRTKFIHIVRYQY